MYTVVAEVVKAVLVDKAVVFLAETVIGSR